MDAQLDDEAAGDHEYLWGRRSSLLWRTRLSALYHQKHARFFDIFEKVVKAAGVGGGSAAFALAADKDLVRMIGAIVAAMSALSLVFAFGDRNRKHQELAKDFKNLEAAICEAGERGYSEDDINVWEGKYARIEAAEPAALGALVQICQNELAPTNNGIPKRIAFLKRLTAHFVNWQLPTTLGATQSNPAR